MHGDMNMTWRASSLSLSAGQVQIALPGGLLNDPGVDNDAWVGSGVVKRIHVNSRDGTGADLALVQVYDYFDETTQRFIRGGSANDPFRIDATANNTPTKGDDFDVVIHGATINAGIAAPGFLTNARLLFQEKAVIEDGTGSFRDQLLHEPNALCIGGMVVVLRSIGAVTGDWSISVSYEPHRLGGYRRQRATQGQPRNLLPI